MISTLDLLYICLSITALAFTGFFAYAAYNVGSTFKAAKKTIDNVETTTHEVKENLIDITDGLKLGALTILGKLIGVKERG